MRSKLKDAYSGLIAHDIDYIVYFPASNSLYILEEKRRLNARTGPAQAVAYAAIADLLRQVNQPDLPKYKACIRFYYNEGTGSFSTNGYDTMSIDEFVRRLQSDAFDTSEEWFRSVIREYLGRLWNCQGSPPYRKTEPERSALRFTPVLHSTDNYTVAKIDWLLINYCSGLIVALSETPLAEREKSLVEKFDRMMRYASELNAQSRYAVNPASRSVYRYLGHFELGYSAQSQFHLTDARLNGIPVSTERLVELLNLESADVWVEEGILSSE